MNKKNLRNKLHSIQQTSSAFYSKNQDIQKQTQTSKIPQRYSRMAEKLSAKAVSNHAGTYLLLEQTYPHDFSHGRFQVSDVGVEPMSVAAFTLKKETDTVSPCDMLFIDTETTGLGGSGAVPFLIGCGSVTDNGFEIRQYLLPDYQDETAMLEHLLMEFGADKTLVSYNGATFDLPLLSDRMIINRVARKVDHKHHVDLLHSARRLFKRRLSSCRLTNIEKELLFYQRVDDLPGYLVPSVYFEWLSSEETDLMPAVIEHNRMDILSLYFIVRLVATAYESRGDNLDRVEDLHSLSCFYDRKKMRDSTAEVIERIEELSDSDITDDMILFQAGTFKRKGNVEKAEQLWLRLCDQKSRESYYAHLELAKLYEHRYKDYKKALEHSSAAEKICPYGKNHLKNLDKRIKRLQQKIGY